MFFNRKSNIRSLRPWFVRNKRPILFGLLTGILYATSYPPFPAWALFFAFAPLWVFWYQAKTWREVALSGFVAQFTMTLIGFNWIAHTAVEYGHLPVIASALILLGFCCFATLSVPIAGVIAWSVQKRWPLPQKWFFVFLAVVSGGCDWLYPTIFPWNTGYPLLYSGFHSAQLAELFGFYFLGVLVYLANACFALSYVKFPAKKWSTPLIVFVIGLFVAEVSGTLLEKRLPPEDKTMHVLAAQPNIGNYDKFYAELKNGYQEPVIRKDLQTIEEGLQSAAAGPKPDLAILPETAYPESLDPWFQGRFYVRELQSFVDSHELPLITGAYSDDPPSDARHRSYNAVFAVLPHAAITPGYRKQILLAFGEYFPGAKYFPFLKNIVPEISDFGRGTGPAAFTIAGARFLPLICYEGLVTEFVRTVVNYGGHILVNVTNDSWFGDYFEPRQHLIMTVARTIEYRRPLIRVTNTGFTVVADVRGHILTRGPQDQSWSAILTVPYYSQPPETLYSSLVPIMTPLFLAFALAVFFVGRRRA